MYIFTCDLLEKLVEGLKLLFKKVPEYPSLPSHEKIKNRTIFRRSSSLVWSVTGHFQHRVSLICLDSTHSRNKFYHKRLSSEIKIYDHSTYVLSYLVLTGEKRLSVYQKKFLSIYIVAIIKN